MNECKIVEDLLPLYAEGLTNEASSEYVRNHVENCEYCARLLQRCHEIIPAGEVDTKAYKKAMRKNQVNLFCKIALLAIVVLVVMVFACEKLEDYILWKEGKAPVEQVIEAPVGYGKLTLVNWEASGRRIGNARNEGTLIRTEMKHFEQDEWGYGWSGSEGEVAEPWENVQAEWAPNGEEIFFMADLLDGGTGIFVHEYEYWMDEEGSHSTSRLLPERMGQGYMDILVEGCRNHPAFPVDWETVSFTFHKWQDDCETITFVYETDNGHRGLLDFHFPTESITKVN